MTEQNAVTDDEVLEYLEKLDPPLREDVLRGLVRSIGPQKIAKSATMIFMDVLLEDVEVRALFVHPLLLEHFVIADVAVGVESLNLSPLPMNGRFVEGMLVLPEPKRLLRLDHVLISVSNRTAQDITFQATLYARKIS